MSAYKHLFLAQSRLLELLYRSGEVQEMKLWGIWCGVVVLAILFCKCINADEGFDWKGGDDSMHRVSADPVAVAGALMVNLSLIEGADAKGAVCLDGTLPGYHFHPGFGKGASNWLVSLEGGGWCNNPRVCDFSKTTHRGSSKLFEKQIAFAGILSNKASENPDFYDWNRVKIRYCDGASFAGEGEIKSRGLQFRGQRIWQAAVGELLSKGMHNANQALLTGCSAGGLAAILHCDQFRGLFPTSTKVKCLSDAGLFMDAMDIAGGRTLRKFFNGVVTLHGVEKNLPTYCTNHLDPTSCFFPQNLIANIKTPLFLLNSAYDTWQVIASLAPPSADPERKWRECRTNIQNCSASQIQFLQDFRNEMLDAVKGFEASKQTGLFINSCFLHCQSESQDTWFGDRSPTIDNKAIATAIGDWYFDRASVKAIDCPYTCDKACSRAE